MKRIFLTILMVMALTLGLIPSLAVYANPAFTARTETFARGSSLTTPFNFTINKATGVVDGDIMFMFLHIYIATPATVDSVPTGWQQVATNTAGASRWYLYYKIASGEGASYIWSLTKSARYYALNVAYSSGDFDVASLADITVSNTLYGTADANVRAASMNVPDANSPLVYFGSVYSTASKTFTKPSVPTTDWVEDGDEGHTTPDLWVTYGSMVWASSGATGVMDITCSATITTEKHAFAVALKPPSGPSAPTVITSAASLVEATAARLNGEVTATGGEDPTVTVYWGDNDGGEIAGNWDFNSVPTSPAQPQGAVTFYKDVTSLNTGTTYYFNAKATNSGGTDWATTQVFLTKPAAPTNVLASDSTYTDKVVITWTQSLGANDYQVYRDSSPLGWLGDVATFDDTGADAPTITSGTANASDGTSSAYVTLSISGESANAGTIHTYKVRAKNATGESADSTTNDGNRGVGSLTYQWQRSAADSDAGYSDLSGAASDPYNDTTGVVAPDGRYYKARLNATGASQVITNADRGYKSGAVVAPTVTTSAATSVEATTATLNGNVTDTGGDDPTVTVYWGDNNGGEVPENWDFNSVPTSPGQPQGVAAFYKDVASLSTGTTYYFNAKATNSAGTDWGTTQTFLTKPAAPTNVQATDGTYTTKVTVTWTKSTGATNYVVYRGVVNASGTLGDVDTFDDTGADAPTITVGTASATDGSLISYVTLSIAGESANNGTSHTYKVVASNATGDGADSLTDTGYRGVGSLTYQWYRSAADSDAGYSSLSGGTTDPYNDTTAPPDGSGRWYYCTLSASGASNQDTNHDRGYRMAASVPSADGKFIKKGIILR